MASGWIFLDRSGLHVRRYLNIILWCPTIALSILEVISHVVIIVENIIIISPTSLSLATNILRCKTCRQAFCLLTGNHCTVKESSRDSEKRPVLFRLSDGRRRLQQSSSRRRSRKWGFLLVNSFLDLLSLFCQPMGSCSEICQAGLSTSGQDLDSFLHVSK